MGPMGEVGGAGPGWNGPLWVNGAATAMAALSLNEIDCAISCAFDVPAKC